MFFTIPDKTNYHIKNLHTLADHNCFHVMIALINKQSVIRFKTTTIQPYSSFVQFVKHKILDGYDVLCTISNFYYVSQRLAVEFSDFMCY